MVQKYIKNICGFIIFLLKCILLTLEYIAIFAIFSKILTSSKNIPVNIFFDIHGSFCKFWIYKFNFHFSYITTFFIFFICGFIKRFLRSNKMFVVKIFFLILAFLTYVGVIFWIYSAINSYNNVKYEIPYQDLLISSVVIFLAISITLFYNFNIESANIKNTNKKIIEKYLPYDKVYSLAFIFNFYFSQYTSFVFLNGKIFVPCVIILSLILVLLVYKFIVFKLTHSYLIKAGEKEDNVYFVINSDTYIEADLWKAFQAPIIFKSSPVLLNGIVVINNQCLAINKEKEYMIIGIDCYSRFLQEQEQISINKNLFCYVIKEKPLLKFFDDVFNIARNHKKVLNVHRIRNILNDSSFLSFFDSINNDASHVVKARQLLNVYNINEIITRIFNFDNYLFTITRIFENSSNKFVIFNTILKGCEAIIHYQAMYFLINEDIKINQEYNYFSKNKAKTIIVNKYLESGSLGAWINLVQEVLKMKNKYDDSWLSRKISKDDSIWGAVLNQQYPNISKSTSVTTNYELITQRIINIRNNTIGHGSSQYVPDNDQLICLFEIYLYLLKETSQNFCELIYSKNQIWMLKTKEDFKLLDIYFPDINKLRYIDYINESFLFITHEQGGDFNV